MHTETGMDRSVVALVEAWSRHAGFHDLNTPAQWPHVQVGGLSK